MTTQLIMQLVREIVVMVIDLIKNRKIINTEAEIQIEYESVIKTFKVHSKIARNKAKEIRTGKW